MGKQNAPMQTFFKSENKIHEFKQRSNEKIKYTNLNKVQMRKQNAPTLTFFKSENKIHRFKQSSNGKIKCTDADFL